MWTALRLVHSWGRWTLDPEEERDVHRVDIEWMPPTPRWPFLGLRLVDPPPTNFGQRSFANGAIVFFLRAS